MGRYLPKGQTRLSFALRAAEGQSIGHRSRMALFARRAGELCQGLPVPGRLSTHCPLFFPLIPPGGRTEANNAECLDTELLSHCF